jgi:16S rRNA (guanine(966)-N(2))-methyltransferase RsmD
MRIISGRFKSRKFNPPADKWPTRPTTDFAKEGLFNILINTIDFEETKVLDLFGGSGNMSFEFISRGSNSVTFVDSYRSCVAFAKKVSEELEITEELEIVKADVFKFIGYSQETFDFIFADPPYDHNRLKEIPDLIYESSLLTEDGLLVVEHDNKTNFTNHPRFKKSKKYGSTIFSFFE